MKLHCILTTFCFQIRWIWRDTYCKPRQAVRMAVEVWKNVDHLDVILGDGCSTGCEPVNVCFIIISEKAIRRTQNLNSLKFRCAKFGRTF